MTGSHRSDDELLRGLRKGEEQAFEEIFKKHWHSLYRVAYSKLRSQPEAEEVVQNIFSALWEKRKTLHITNLQGYLLMSVRNRIINQIRDKLTERKYWNYYKEFIPEGKETTEMEVLYDDLHEAVEVAVKRLPEKSKQVFRLSRLEGKSVSEIARLMKLSEKAIEYHLTKSLKELRLYLKDFILILLIGFLQSPGILL